MGYATAHQCCVDEGVSSKEKVVLKGTSDAAVLHWAKGQSPLSTNG